MSGELKLRKATWVGRACRARDATRAAIALFRPPLLPLVPGGVAACLYKL